MTESVERLSTVLSVIPRVIRVINREDLMNGEREILIDHNGALYRLSVTKAEKLILNKSTQHWIMGDQ